MRPSFHHRLALRFESCTSDASEAFSCPLTGVDMHKREIYTLGTLGLMVGPRDRRFFRSHCRMDERQGAAAAS